MENEQVDEIDAKKFKSQYGLYDDPSFLERYSPFFQRYTFGQLTLLSACLVLFSCILESKAEPLKGNVQQEAMPVSGDILRGWETDTLPPGMKFSQTVEAVGPELKVHKLFSSVNMPVEDKEDLWYQIPKWRAGFFHRDKQIDHYTSGDRETVSKVDHLYGMQVDKNGDIWHHVSWPRITKVSSDGYSQYKVINRYEPVVKNDHEFCVKISSTNIDVDDKTGKIVRVAKQEEFDRYFPAGPKTAMGACFIQGFSVHGRPNTEIERCSVEETMVKPFSVLNSFRGKDLRESLRRFMQAHEMADIMPEALPPTSKDASPTTATPPSASSAF